MTALALSCFQFIIRASRLTQLRFRQNGETQKTRNAEWKSPHVYAAARPANRNKQAKFNDFLLCGVTLYLEHNVYF